MKKIFIIAFIIIQVYSLSGCGNVSDTTRTHEDIQITASEINETVFVTETEEITTNTDETTTVQEESISTDNTTSENETAANIVLDKTYHNERFGFEFKYPGIWSLVEESKNEELPEQDPQNGAVVFIDDNSVSSTPIVNFDRSKDYIRVYGQVSTPAIPGEPTGEFTTDDGIKGMIYYNEVDGKMSTHIVFLNENSGHGYGATVNVSKELNEKYGDVITKILKSIKLP